MHYKNLVNIWRISWVRIPVDVWSHDSGIQCLLQRTHSLTNDRLNDHLTFASGGTIIHHVQEEVSFTVKSWGKLLPCDYFLHSELTACVLSFNTGINYCGGIMPSKPAITEFLLHVKGGVIYCVVCALTSRTNGIFPAFQTSINLLTDLHDPRSSRTKRMSLEF